jgi:hypothetical protein
VSYPRERAVLELHVQRVLTALLLLNPPVVKPQHVGVAQLGQYLGLPNSSLISGGLLERHRREHIVKGQHTSLQARLIAQKDRYLLNCVYLIVNRPIYEVNANATLHILILRVEELNKLVFEFVVLNEGLLHPVVHMADRNTPSSHRHHRRWALDEGIEIYKLLFEGVNSNRYGSGFFSSFCN